MHVPAASAWPFHVRSSAKLRPAARRDEPTRRGMAHDGLSIVFHWVTALIVAAAIVLALAPGLIAGSVDLHKTLGMTLIALVPLRAAWRMRQLRRRAHAPFDSVARANRANRAARCAATATHMALYGLLVAVPLLGWAYAGAKGQDINLLGLALPNLVEFDRDLAARLWEWKRSMAYAMLALIGLHAGAAIVWHGLVRRDGVLTSMMPIHLAHQRTGRAGGAVSRKFVRR